MIKLYQRPPDIPRFCMLHVKLLITFRWSEAKLTIEPVAIVLPDRQPLKALLPRERLRSAIPVRDSQTLVDCLSADSIFAS